jgi:hypothetical protein
MRHFKLWHVGGLRGLTGARRHSTKTTIPARRNRAFPIAKDSWMFAIGLSLMTDALPFGR